MSQERNGEPERPITRRAFLQGALVAAGGVAGLSLVRLPSARADTLGVKPTLYLIADAHIDSQWNWTVQHVISDCVPATMRPNWALFEKYPDYTFNFEGVIHYMFFKEYHPEDWSELQQWVAKGRWRLSGSWINAVDVNVPSPESLFRQALYGQQFFRREFDQVSRDIFLPDCFGFPYSLPSIGRHSGLNSFSTQKFDLWGGWFPTPFSVGRWRGADGAELVSALKPGPYVTHVHSDVARDPHWTNHLADAGGREVNLRYFGTGDQGGTPGDESISWVERAIQDVGGAVRVVNTSADQLARDLSPAETAALPLYQGELTMKTHGVGGYSSQAAHKKWNRRNEQMADAAERASLAAAWLGGPAYPQATLSAAWIRTLWHQHHDDLPGTCIPQAYTFTWNDDLLNLNQFSQVVSTGVGAVAQHLDTAVAGVPLVVYNPLSLARTDAVEATVTLPRAAKFVRVYDGATGAEVPSQVLSRKGRAVTVLFLASVPPVGFHVYAACPAPAPCALPTGLSVSGTGLESDHYKVSVNAAGDIRGVYDKRAKVELLSAPSQLQQFHDFSPNWPAWEILWDTVHNPPRGTVSENPRVRVSEHGPARVALEVTRGLGDSTFVQHIRLTPGGDWVEVFNEVDWQTPGTLVKAAFPMTAANPNATFDLGLGTIERPNAEPNRYEVNAQQWADLTDVGGDHGLAILSDYKYGWDKPDDNTLRLTLIRTPDGGGSYSHQNTNDIGHHDFSYALAGHAGDWRAGRIPQRAARLNQPLMAFQTSAHGGAGRYLSLARVSTDQVAIRALKKAEDTDEWVVRVQELHGQPAAGVTLALAAPVVSAREINAAEEAVGPYQASDGNLLLDLTPYQPRTFAVRLAHAPKKIAPLISTPVPLPYNLGGTSLHGDRAGVAFDALGRTYPGELWPSRLTADGIAFHLGGTAAGTKNMVSCHGQAIALPAGSHDRLYLLAASAHGDQHGAFTVHAKTGRATTETLKVQDWAALVGQWYSRIANNDPDDPARFTPGTTYFAGRILENVAVKNIRDGKVVHLDRLKPAFVKRDNVAWVGTHRHGPSGDMPYCFCYLFKYALDLPPGATHVTLPVNPNIRVAAMTAARNTLDDTRPAGLMYEPKMGSVGVTRPAVVHYESSDSPVFVMDAAQPFDGTANGLTKPDVAGLPTDAAQPWTINLFVYTESQPGELTVLGGFGDGTDNSGCQRYLIKFHNAIHFWGSNVDVDTTEALDLGKWQMLTATYDGHAVTLYKNAQKIGAQAVTLDDAAPAVQLATSGPWQTGHRFTGRIAGFKIWNRALDADAVRAQLASEPQQ